jgi:hypothetical protein
LGRQLDKYLETLYGEQAGYVYVASKQTSGGFQQNFYRYPDERGEITATILSSVILGEVYVCPSLFASPKGTKDQCLGSSVTWVDFDGNFPTTWPKAVPVPSMVIQTSSNRNVHAYWKLDDFLTADSIEEINRRLCYFFGADVSGWDANQLLRPPETRNHKRGGSPVGLTTTGCGETYSPGLFAGLPKPPTLPKNLATFKIPPIEEAHANIDWPVKLRDLFDNGVPEGADRSAAMFALAAGLAEINIQPPYILSALLHSDNHAFHKFDKRPDQLTRLFELVTRAVSKTKAKAAQSQKVESDEKWTPTTFGSLLKVQSTMEWLWEPYLHRTSCVILSGPPGVGKSLMTLSLAQSLALGKDFLGVPVQDTLRVCFLSLEMGVTELSLALKLQSSVYSEDEKAKLTENFLLQVFGEPRNFTNKATEKALYELVGDHHFNGIFIDSLSSTTPGDLSSEKETKALFELDARLRAKFGCFTWYIHHNRKAQADNKKPNKADDVFGSVHIQSKPSALITLWTVDAKKGRIIFKPLKTRAAPQPNEFTIVRNEFLHYDREYNISGSPSVSGVTVEAGKEEVDVVGSDSENSPSDGDGGDGTANLDFEQQ